MNKLIIPVAIVLIIAAGIVAVLVLQKPVFPEPSSTQQESVIVKQSGGIGMPIPECGDRNYITNTADYIIEGTVEKVESKWDKDKTSIFTYSDLKIEKYVKGAPFAEDKLQIVTPGGTVEGIIQAVEDQPIFHKDKKVKIHFQKTKGEFVIVCAKMGVEEMGAVLEKPRYSIKTHQVWFTPAPASDDLLQLFTKPEQWEQTKSKIDVYGFFSQQMVSSFSEKQVANAGLEEGKVLRFVFSKLKEWKKESAIEVSSGVAIRFKGGAEGEKKYRETGVAECKTREQAINDYATHTKEAIKRALSLGGAVKYVAMDELLHYWYPYPAKSDERSQPCKHNNISEIAKDTATYIKQVQTAYPSVVIGDIEPYPIQSAENLKNWVIELEKNDIYLPFLHLDVDMGQVNAISKGKEGTRIDVVRDLQELKSFFKAHNIPFGIIYTDNTWDNIEGWKDGKIIYKKEYSDKDYYENTIEWIRIVNNAIGEPDHSIFNSWREAYGEKHKKIPYNLTENDSYSHTRLINEGLKIFRGEE